MEIKDFKLIKNKQRPDFCYSYVLTKGDYKFTIFTMDGGKTFHASIEAKRLDGKYYSEDSMECYTVVDSVEFFRVWSLNKLIQ